MGDFLFRHPLGKFLFDVAVGGVIGASTATLDLGPAASFDQATAAIALATILGIRSAAATAIVAAVRALRERGTP